MRLPRLIETFEMRKYVPIVAMVCFCLTYVGWGSDAHASAQSRRIVVDTYSGYAISGYDPVAYFTDKQAKKGKAKYEVVWKGVSWIFDSEANMNVFKQDPEIYAPKFGGHGALAMARGYVSGSNSNVWALYKNQLYLFYSYTSRAAWAEAVEQHVDRGDKNWQEIEPNLAR